MSMLKNIKGEMLLKNEIPCTVAQDNSELLVRLLGDNFASVCEHRHFALVNKSKSTCRVDIGKVIGGNAKLVIEFDFSDKGESQLIPTPLSASNSQS